MSTAFMRACIPFAIGLVVGALACGETTSNTGSRSDSGSGAGASYAGVVVALRTEHDATTSYDARAVFTMGPRPSFGGCPRCCCSRLERGLPLPGKRPDAAEISLLPAAGSSALATLVPDEGVLHGMLDLGWSWAAPLSNYAPMASQAWSADDILEVRARGNEVEPFSGTLRAGPPMGGVTPPIGSSPIFVDHHQPFEISWSPEGDGDGTVLLGIPNGTGVCYCDAPDSAGALIVDADLLSRVSGEISLARLTVSTIASGNASIDLVGAVIQRGPVEVQ